MKNFRVAVFEGGALHFFEDFDTVEQARVFYKRFSDLDFNCKITYLGDDPKEASLC